MTWTLVVGSILLLTGLPSLGDRSLRSFVHAIPPPRVGPVAPIFVPRPMDLPFLGAGALTVDLHPNSVVSASIPRLFENVTPLYPQEWTNRIAYDSTDRYLVIFATECCSGVVGSDSSFTYIVRNRSIQIDTSAPSPQSLGDYSSGFFGWMADDPPLHGVLLWITHNGTGAGVDQTWLFHKGNWTRLTPAHSLPIGFGRTYSNLVYDPRVGGPVTEMFNTSGHNRLWGFVGGNWSAIRNGTPGGFPGYIDLAYDTTDGYLLGYANYGGGPNMTWKLDPGGWARASNKTFPPQLLSTQLENDPAVGGAILVSGTNATSYYLNTHLTWVYARGNWTAHNISQMPYDPVVSATFDPLAGGPVAFGAPGNGFGPTPGAEDADLWSLNATGWKPFGAVPILPAPRQGASSTFDAKDGYYLLYGGGFQFTSMTTPHTFNDTWSFQNGSWKDRTNGTTPPALWYGNLVYDAADGYTVLAGGQLSNLTWQTATWKYSGGAWSSLPLAGFPASGQRGCTVFDSGDGYVLNFGGVSGSSYSSATWEFSAGTWQAVTTTGAPPAMAGCQLTYDNASGRVVLFGGANNTTAFNQTWTYHSKVWTQVHHNPSPAGRTGAYLAYDPLLKQIILFGGLTQGGTALDDLWGYARGNWSRITAVLTPSGLWGGNAVYDPRSLQLLFFGGVVAGGISSQMWQLHH